MAGRNKFSGKKGIKKAPKKELCDRRRIRTLTVGAEIRSSIH